MTGKIFYARCFRPGIVLLALTLGICGFVRGQQNPDIRFEHISSETFRVEKGLSQNSINCILQDQKGYMWFGTWDGLNKYDGYTFTVYRAGSSRDSNMLSNQTINALYEDSDGLLWIGTETGLNCLDRKKQKIIQFLHDKSDPVSISSDSVLCIAEDGLGMLWIGTRNGLNKYDKNTGHFTCYRVEDDRSGGISNNNINALLPGSDGKLYIGTNKGLNILNLKTGTFFYLFNEPGNENSLCSDVVFSMTFDGLGQLWMGTDNCLVRFNFAEQKFKHYDISPGLPGNLTGNNVNALLFDSDGQLWAGTNGGGLALYDQDRDRFIAYRSSPNDPNSISNDYITSIYEDRSGILWIGTEWRGVNKINKDQAKFQHFHHIRENPNSLQNNIVWSIFQDQKGRIWVGTEEGINIIDRQASTCQTLKKNPRAMGGLINNQVRGMKPDGRGNIWIGTFGFGLNRYDPVSGDFALFKAAPGMPNSLSNDNIWCILEDRTGHVWFGTDGGLNRYDYNRDAFEVFRHEPGDARSLAHNTVLSLFEDSEGKIWASTYGGISVFDYKTGKFKNYKHNPDDPYSLSSDYVFSVYQSRYGIYWITTQGGGLNRLDPKTGRFKCYREEDGLANNVTYDVFEDKSGKLWISTNSGISRFNPKTATFVNYEVKDGVQSNEFNLGAAYHNRKTDEMFFGGMNGFNAFIPEQVKSNSYIPGIVISSFKIFDKARPVEISDGDTIHLSYFDNFFSFEFSALDFTNPSKNHYAYMLEQFDKDWIFCDAYKRFAGYTNVSPGTYVFRVKGTNSDGVWNEEGISVVIIISPAWWSTWWFRVLAAILVIALVWYIIYMRLRNIRIKHEDEKRILEIEKQMFSLEQTALRLQINPHFIFNSLNSIQSFVISNDTDRAINYLAKFAQLMRLILSNSHQTFVPISDELRAISYYLDIEKLRFNNKFDYSIRIDPAIDADFMDIPPMIIQPYIENAILHGILHKKTTGSIIIEMTLQGNSLLCVVEDDGVGRERAAEIKAGSDLLHKSRGMLITQKRLELLNKQNKEQMSVEIVDLKDGEGKASGTRVNILITYKEL